MKIVNHSQGSDGWLAFRATRFGSSEAAAMLGLSPHCTRSELLRMKHTGLPQEFSAWKQRNILDKGHAVEAATRPKIEALIDEILYPVVCEGEGRLAASCDGLGDGLGEILRAWECKQWNEALAAEVSAGRVPDTHMPQCQHILMVTGADVLIFTVSDGEDRMVSTEVLPSPEWFERLRNGWAQFSADLAAYVPPAAAEPAPVGRAPETLPALRIEVTGAVTASNLAEFKATALAAIRSVNRDLKTDQDFADARKAIKWCEEVEERVKRAKESVLAQTATIEEAFRTLDDIAAESKDVRLSLDKLSTKRSAEIKEQAVLAARAALDKHIADLNGELAPMTLRPVAVDFAVAIKGLRSIASMQDALDTALAGGKIAADAQARVIRGNVAAFKTATGEDRTLQALFADLGQLVHKAADDFAAVLDHRITKHRADEAERERKRQEAEAARIAEAERRAAAEAEARVRAEQEAQARREREAAEAAAPAAAPAPAPTPLAPLSVSEPVGTGVALPMPTHAAPQLVRPVPAPAANEPATLKLGVICERLGFNVTAAFLADVLHIQHSATDKAAKLYRESDWPVICAQLRSHIGAMAELYGQQRAA